VSGALPVERSRLCGAAFHAAPASGTRWGYRSFTTTVPIIPASR